MTADIGQILSGARKMALTGLERVTGIEPALPARTWLY